MIDLFAKYKEIILYIFFGISTTIVNICTYYICTRLLSMEVMESTIVAWCISVLFAYITNKIYVFNSHTFIFNVIFREFIFFVSSRILSGLIDMFIMFVFVDSIGYDDMTIKIVSNFFVIIFNYIASKLVVFKK